MTLTLKVKATRPSGNVCKQEGRVDEKSVMERNNVTTEILSYSKPIDDLPIEYFASDENALPEALDPDTIALNWALNAEALQQDLYLRLGNRIFDEYSINEAEYLEVKIAYAKFGPPNITDEKSEKSITYDEFQKIHHYENEKSNLIQAYSTLYSQDQRKKTHETLNLILKLVKKQDSEVKNFNVAFIFVVYQLGETDLCGLIPIIRILKKEGDPDDEVWYVDQENRVYTSWENYLDENRLPKLRICYPKNGYYSVNDKGYSIYMPEKRVVVGFGMTPATKLSHKLLRGLDWTSSGVLIGSLGIAVAAALSAPISAPILTGAAISSSVAAAYGATRSGATLVDRKIHEQTINVKNSEARSCWIGIGGAVFALSASSATMLLERAVELGQTVGTSAVYTVNGLNTGALVFNAAGVANQAHYLGERLVKGEGITAFEVLEFTLSTFLFTNSLISFQMANTQLLEGQHKEHVQGAIQTGDAKKGPGLLDRFTKHFEAENLFDRNSRVIRTLNSIENPKQFFTKSVELTKQINKVAGKVSTQHKHKYDVNGAIINSGVVASQTDYHLKVPSPTSSFPRTFSDPTLNHDNKTRASKESISSFTRTRLEEILLNDYKFLLMIKLENDGYEGVKKLENRIFKIFDAIPNKDFTQELLKICIKISKELGIDHQEEFWSICSAAKKIFVCNTQPLLKKFSSDVEEEILGQLKDENGSIYKNLVEEIKVEYFRKLNDKNDFRFEDAIAAYHSYQFYIAFMKSQTLLHIKPKQFMEKVNWLFKETQPQDRNLVSYKGRSQFRNLHISGGWRGVLYEDEKNPFDQVVTEFEYKGELSRSASKNLIDKIGSIFQ